jgi:hypothetical protein
MCEFKIAASTESSEQTCENDTSDDKEKIRQRNIDLSKDVRLKFNIGDWVFGIGEHKGCSPVFEGTYCDYQPFSYLNDFNPDNFRLATELEIEEVKST